MEHKNGEKLKPAALPNPHNTPVIVSLVSGYHKIFQEEQNQRANETHTNRDKQFWYQGVLVGLLFLAEVVKCSSKSAVSPKAEETI